MTSTLSCGREVTAPEGGRLSRSVAIQPTLRLRSGAALVLSGVDFARLRLTLARRDGTVAYDRVVDFPASADSVGLSVAVQLSPDAPPAGERMALRVGLITSAGDTVFRNGPDTLLMEPALVGVAPAAVDVDLFYTGPGVQAARVTLTPVVTDTLAGTALSFTAQAFDAQDTPVPDAPILFTSSDTSVIRFANARIGAATTGNRRSSALVIASLLTGAADSANVSLALPASLIVAASGAAQTAVAGTVLPDSVVVRVTASDAVGVAGISVAFAASNGGTVASSTVVTDANGRAATRWTLGAVGGAQTLSATASGLTGSPVVFSATAVGEPATQLAFTASPSTTVAGASLGTITVEARDAAGIIDIAFAGAVTLAIAANPGGGTLAGTVVATASAGIATFSGVSINRTGVGYSLVATAGALTSPASAAFTVSPGAATQLALTTAPSPSTAAGSAFAQQPVVEIRDAQGNVVTSGTGSTAAVTLALTTGTGTLSGTATVNAVAGVATFSGLSMNLAGTDKVLTASSGALGTIATAPFTIVPSAATQLAFITAPSVSSAAGTAFAQQPVVEIRDAQGNRVTTGAAATEAVTVALTSGTGTLGGTATVNAVAGVATFSGLSIDLAGSDKVLTAESGVLTPAATAPFTIAAGAATQLVFTTEPSASTTAGTAFAQQPVVEVRDALGNRVTSGTTSTAAVTLTLSTGTGTLGGTATVNAVAGVATFSGLSINLVGTDKVFTASSGAFATDATAPFTIAPGAATQLVFSVQPTNSAVGGVISPAIVVRALDAFSNVAEAFGAVVTIAIGTNPSGATLSGTTATNAIAGVATFAGLGLDAIGFGYTLAATALGVTGAVSDPFDATLSGALIAWTNAAGGNWSTPTNWDLGRTPNSLDTVTIALPGTYSVTLDTDYTGTLLTVGGGAGLQTLALTSRTLTLSGALSVQSTGELSLNAATVAAPVVNAGTVRSVGTSALTGALTTTAGSLLRVEALASVNQPTLTVANGFTNLGLIEVTSNDAIGSPFEARLVVSSGTLVNAPSGTIAALDAPPNRARYIDALLDNQGTISVAGLALTLTLPTNAVWENTGTISGTNLRINQSGPSASFTNRGTISMPAPFSQMNIFFGSFTHAVGAALNVSSFFSLRDVNATLDGAFTVGTLAPDGGTITLGAGASTAGTDFRLSLGATLTGLGTLTISVGKLLSLDSATVTVPVLNSGTLVVRSRGTISGPLTTTATSVVSIQSVGSPAAMTVASGFTNLGQIELIDVGGSASDGTLTVTSGTLLNALGGTIRVRRGVGGLRTLTAALDNQGTLDIYPDSAGLFTINGNVTTSGIINVDVGGLSAGTQYGQIAVNGTLSLGGTLNVGLFGGYVPAVGNIFTLLTSAGATTGTFTAVNLAPPLTPPVTYLANSVAVSVQGAQIGWTNASGGNWSTPTNWDLGRVPNSADSVTIALAGTYAVTLDTTYAGTMITVGGGAGAQTLALTSRTLTLSGPLSVQSTGSLALRAATVAAPVVNAGTLLASGRSFLNGALTTVGGSTLRVSAVAPNDTNTFTVATGFTNLGAIELTNGDAGGDWTPTLTVSSGTLVNAPTGTITASVGALSGRRDIIARLDNQGSIITVPDVAATLWIFLPFDAVWENTGTITASDADVLLIQNGPAARFTNRGTVTTSTDGQLSIFFGGFTHAAGATLNGGGTLAFNSVNAALDESFTLGGILAIEGTLALGAGVNTAGTSVTLFNGAQVTGPGTLTNSVGEALTLDGSTVTTAVLNEGTINVWGASNINAPLTTTSTSVVRVASVGSGGATLTVANGFTNSGLIELSNAAGSDSAWAAALTVTSGTLVNALGGTVRTRAHDFAGLLGGGLRTLTAALDNQGTLDIYPDTAGLFTINGNVTTSGIINVDVGGLSAGTQHGQIAVNGTLTLGGTLNVGLFGGYVPAVDDTFTLLTSTGAATGAFTTANLAPPLAAPVTYGANSVAVSVPLVGAQIAWTNAAGGNWSVPANWDLGRVPNPSDSVTIALAGAYSVTLDTNYTGRLLTVGGGAGTQTLALSSRTLTLAGPLSVQATGVLVLNAATVAAPVVNAGTLTASGTSALTSTLTTTAGSVLRVAALASVSEPVLTVANGFTNLGLIELTNTDGGIWDARLVVSSGTLVNAPSGTITTLLGARSSNRHLNALLDNQGSITTPQLGSPLSIYLPTNAVWENTGTMSGTSVRIYQRPSGSFTNRGTIALESFQIDSGSFTHAVGATLSGSSSLAFVLGANATLDEVFTAGTLYALWGSTIALGASTNTAGTSVFVSSGSTVTGPGSLTISVGRELRLDSATVTVPVLNSGTLSSWGASTISGPLTTTATSVMQVQVQSVGKNAALTVASGFTNLGLITLRNGDPNGFVWDAALTVTSGTLLNALGGTIRAFSAGGGLRTLTAALDNQGTLDFYPDTAGQFTINGNVTTSGIINLDVGGLTAGTQYGRVAVNGTLSLGGTLNVGLFGGYVPVSTNSFTILTSTGARTGTFATPVLTAPLALPVTYSANAVAVGVP